MFTSIVKPSSAIVIIAATTTTLLSVIVMMLTMTKMPTVHAFTTLPKTSSSKSVSFNNKSLISSIEARNSHVKRWHSSTFTLSATSDSTTQSATLLLTLEKPLGLILEEVDSSSSNTGGVIVAQVNENGSAYASTYRDTLPQMKIKSVMGQDVSSYTLENVMETIINAPTPVDIEFVSIKTLSSSSVEVKDDDEEEEAARITPNLPTYAMGTRVTITVQQPAETRKSDIIIEAKVGDNLRKTLLSNPDIELYRGLKKKLGNCGGGGQCGFCAVEVMDDDQVWGERSEYEAKKIGKNGNDKTRLACLNNIVGPAIVKTL